MAFTGAWRSGAYLAPDEFTRHEPDPRHTEHPPEDEANASTYAAPPQDDPGVFGEYPGMDWVIQTAGRIVDATDTRSHERDDGDHGAAVAGAFSERATAFADERYTHDSFEFTPSTEVNPVALQRGLNGLPQNNPEGFRAGFHLPTWATRRFPIGERRNDERVLLPDVAYAEGEAKPLSDGLYPTSFGSLARSITNVNQRPQARREPPPMLADEITDGSPYDSAMSGDWVL